MDCSILILQIVEALLVTLGHRDNSMESRDQEAPQREVRGFIPVEPESVLLGGCQEPGGAIESSTD